ncbi:MAG: virulence protein [Limosilactobacillus fermentum]|nr:MAG: virulence protein [Limosilactobacillus fermentum]
MEKRYNVTGERRKEMVKVISGIVGMKAVYMRMPTCAYAISNFTVSREGTLAWDERSSEELVEKVLAGLAQAGFTAEPEETTEEQAETQETAEPEDSAEADAEGTAEPEEAAGPQEGIGLTVSLPRESFTDAALENLRKLVDAKAALIKKALAVESLPVEADEEKVSFPWFADGQDGDAAKAYMHFITALCDMARKQKRVTAKGRSADNEKYAFRCFLLRLGFIGEEYKGERKVLLKNLSGNGSFKSGARKGAADDGVSE